MKTNPALAPLARAVGTWDVTGSHPALGSSKVHGRVTFARVEDGAFLRMHSKMTDARFPEGVAFFGTDGDHADVGTMIYFDERGVARTYAVAFHDDGFTWSRDARKLSQRFRVTIAADGRTMEGEGSMKEEDGAWGPDLCLSYVRVDA